MVLTMPGRFLLYAGGVHLAGTFRMGTGRRHQVASEFQTVPGAGVVWSAQPDNDIAQVSA